jgi:hypothetical protein
MDNKKAVTKKVSKKLQIKKETNTVTNTKTNAVVENSKIKLTFRNLVGRYTEIYIDKNATYGEMLNMLSTKICEPAKKILIRRYLSDEMKEEYSPQLGDLIYPCPFGDISRILYVNDESTKLSDIGIVNDNEVFDYSIKFL